MADLSVERVELLLWCVTRPGLRPRVMDGNNVSWSRFGAVGGVGDVRYISKKVALGLWGQKVASEGNQLSGEHLEAVFLGKYRKWPYSLLC